LAGVFQTVVNAPVFDAEPRTLWALEKGKQSLRRLVAGLAPDVVHVQHGVRPEYVESLANEWPTIYSAHVPVCPNGARFRHGDGEICERLVSMACVTRGFRHEGCGQLSTRAPVAMPGFVRSLWTTKKLLRSMELCRFVVASSNWQRDMLVRDGVTPARVVVVASPIEAFTSTEDAPRTRPVVAFVGRLLVTKGVEHVVRASAVIGTDHELWFIGDGPERERLRQLGCDLGIESRVQFVGSVDPARVGEYMARSQVVVVPSLSPETFNQVGAQAAELGRWVVVYDAGGTRDWSALYPNVIRVPHGQWQDMAVEVERVLDLVPPAVPEGTGHFSPEAHVDRLLELYERAASQA
jgi:glycosyltransferase involved in cell wall biosynthesis